MNTQDVHDLIINVQNAAQIEKLSREIKVGEQAIRDFSEQLEAAGGSHSGIEAAMQRAARNVTEFRTELDRVQTAQRASAQSSAEAARELARFEQAQREAARAAAATKTQVYELADSYEVLERRVATSARAVAGTQINALNQIDVSMRQVGETAGRNGKMGQGIMQASFALQDFTSSGITSLEGLRRGLYSVQNNVSLIAMSLGAGAGLAGAVSIVSVGVGLLIDNWSSIEKLWKGNEAEKQAEAMKKLAEATKAAADETERLKKFQGSGIDERKSLVEGAIKEVGYAQAVKDVKEAMLRQGPSFGAQADQAMAEGLVRNATRGHTGALTTIEEMFQGTNAGVTSKLGKAIDDPGGKKTAAARSANADLQAEAEKAGDERRKKEAAEAEDLRLERSKRTFDEFMEAARRGNRQAARRDGAIPSGGSGMTFFGAGPHPVGPGFVGGGGGGGGFGGGPVGPGLPAGPGFVGGGGGSFGGGLPDIPTFPAPPGGRANGRGRKTPVGDRTRAKKAARKDQLETERARKAFKLAEFRARLSRSPHRRRPRLVPDGNALFDEDGKQLDEGGLIATGNNLVPFEDPHPVAPGPPGSRGRKDGIINNPQAVAQQFAQQTGQQGAYIEQLHAMIQQMQAALERTNAAVGASFRQQRTGGYSPAPSTW